MISWRSRRQLIIAGIFVFSLGGIIYSFLPSFIVPPSCTDGKKNQNELDVDCGGSCPPCELKNPKPIEVFWSRVVPTRQDTYDAVAYIRNLNEELSSPRVLYQFTLFEGSTPVAVRTGSTFLFGQERSYIIETNMKTIRLPSRVEFSIMDVQWQYREFQRPSLVVERQEYRVQEAGGNTKEGILEIVVLNRSAFDFKEIEILAAVFDEEGNLLGASRTAAEKFRSGERRAVKAIWPGGLGGNIGRIAIDPRVNLFDPFMVIKPGAGR
jgi:hypothetical protein